MNRYEITFGFYRLWRFPFQWTFSNSYHNHCGEMHSKNGQGVSPFAMPSDRAFGFLYGLHNVSECAVSYLRSSYQYMIDNVVLLITGTLHERDITELIEKCHPLGMFDAMASLSVATNVSELYNSVLVDTPLGMCRLSCWSVTQPPTFKVACPKKIWTKWTLRSSETHCTRHTWRISMLFARDSEEKPLVSCALFWRFDSCHYLANYEVVRSWPKSHQHHYQLLWNGTHQGWSCQAVPQLWFTLSRRRC